MPVMSVGDMARQFNAMRSGSSIKTELADLTQRMSTGRVNDITAHLGGNTARLSGLDHRLSQLDSSIRVAGETAQTLSAMQSVLERVDSLRGETSQQLLHVTAASQPNQIDEVATAARDSFETMVSALNTQVAGRALFGGVEVDRRPLGPAEDMLADLQTFIGGATTPAAIIAAVDFWFDDPAGGFATMGYQGDTGPVLSKRLTENEAVDINARADDPAIRDTLKAAAMAAMAHDLTGLTRATQTTLLQEAGTRLFGASDGLVAAQSRLGFVEEAVDRASVEMTAQQTSLKMSRNDLIAADPFDTASRLQSIQLQLETHYTVTARMSRLTLLEYI